VYIFSPQSIYPFIKHSKDANCRHWRKTKAQGCQEGCPEEACFEEACFEEVCPEEYRLEEESEEVNSEILFIMLQ